jgi:SAM-dependent methyltransferase
VLDKLSGEPLCAAYKQRLVELLEPQPGGAYLEVGTGTGTDALTVATQFGAEVTGVDFSHAMIEEARRRGLRQSVVADAHALPFESGTFDGAWADRTFQHLADPVAALAEMVRVLKPGGVLVVADPDYSTQAVALSDQGLARRVLRFRAELALRNGTLAHEMGRLFADAGLTAVQVDEMPIVVRDPAALDNALGLRDWAGFAHENGLVEACEVDAWQTALDEAAANGSFLYSFSIFITSGRTR